jgi:hypothetical protein
MERSRYGLEPVTIDQTDYMKSLREFVDSPRGFMEAAIGSEPARVER